MKTTTRLKIIRGCTTVFFASIIFICGFFLELNIQIAAAVLSGCILGGIQGAGSTGIFIIAQFILSGFSLEQIGNFTAIFASTFISGLIAGSPSIIEEKFSPKTFFRILFGCLIGFVIYYFFESLFHKNLNWIYFLSADIFKCIGIIIFSIAIRPKLATFLFPSKETEKEIEELINKLK